MSENTVSDQFQQRFGQYNTQHVITKTNIYAVYAGQSKDGEALFIEHLLSDDEQFIEQFEERVAQLKELNHPSVAPVLENGRDDQGQPFIVYGPTSGTILSNRLHPEGTPFSEIESLTIGRHLMEAIQALELHEMLHLDLRPDNIILTDNGNVSLIGVATPHTANLENRPFSKRYLDFTSPEQIDGKPLSIQSNMFSLGVILYNLLAGHPPKYRITNWDIFAQGDEITFDDLINVNKELNPRTYQLVRRCLGRKEWSRFEQAQDFITAVNSAIRVISNNASSRTKVVSPVKIPIPVKLPKKSRIPKDNRVLYGVAALIMALIVIGALAIFRANQNKELIQNTNDSPSGLLFGDATSEPTQTSRPPTQTPIPLEATLLQPPDGAEFTNQDQLTFAWTWPRTLLAAEQFVLIIKFGNQIVYQAEVDEPSGNARYQHLTNLEDVASSSGPYSWQVLLVDEDGVTRYSTQSGEFIIIVNTPTPTLTPTSDATETPTLTPTPTETSTVTPTATSEVCVPIRPPGWVEYEFKAGDILFNLAIQTGTTVERIENASCISADAIRVGTPIFLPSLPPSSQPTNTPPSGGGDDGGGDGGGSGGGGGSNPPPTQPPPPPQATPTPPSLP